MISSQFRDDEGVAAYDIFNEPHLDLGIDAYKSATQAAVDAIRSNGDTHRIWVEGMTGGPRGTLPSLAKSGPWLNDPLDNLEYSQHFYLQGGSLHSLTARLGRFGAWCEQWHVPCSVGEVGWKTTATPDAQQAFDNFYSEADRLRMDVTYFGASSISHVSGYYAYAASGATPMTIDSTGPQADVVERHLGRVES